MDLTLVKKFNLIEGEFPEECVEILEKYHEITTILDETYTALGQKNTFEITATCSSTNDIFDVQSQSPTSQATIDPGLA